MTIDRAINLIILLKGRLRKKLTEDEQIALRLAVDVLIDKMNELVGKDINTPTKEV